MVWVKFSEIYAWVIDEYGDGEILGITAAVSPFKKTNKKKTKVCVCVYVCVDYKL